MLPPVNMFFADCAKSAFRMLIHPELTPERLAKDQAAGGGRMK
jgi:hypothetical protein